MSFKIVSFNGDSKSSSNFGDLEDYESVHEANIQMTIENDDEIYNNQYHNQNQNILQNQYKNNQTKSNNPQLKRAPNAISYDDILNSLGFGVNNNVLYKKNTVQQSNFQTIHQTNKQQQNFSQKQHLDPRVKNSAIYNKYFKNYKDPNEVILPIIPLTPQQIKIKLVKEHIERQQAKKRIQQIKSKKLFYTSPNLNARPQQIHIQQPVNLNRLFMFSNRK